MTGNRVLRIMAATSLVALAACAQVENGGRIDVVIGCMQQEVIVI